MSRTENGERKSGSGCDLENERDKSVALVTSAASIGKEIQATSNTSEILDDASSEPEKDDDKNDMWLSPNDICRICHMGTSDNHSDTQNWDPTPAGFVYLGPLISACKCRGTVGLVHVECLERWLTESGRARCELCGYKYATKRVPRHNILRSVVIWFNTVIATRQMLLDIGYLAMTTPVALFSCYIYALALRMLLRNGFYGIPWMIVAMLPTCLLTLIAYWRWIITLGRLHGHRWRRYWRNNFVIRLIPDVDNVESIDAIDRRSTDDHQRMMTFEEMEEYA